MKKYHMRIFFYCTISLITFHLNSCQSLDTAFPSSIEDDGCIVRNSKSLKCGDSNIFKGWLRSAKYQIIEQIEHIDVGEWRDRVLNLLLLTKFLSVKEFVVKRGNLTNFAGDFPALPKLQKIIITDNKVEEVHPTLFKNLPALTTVDLRRNKLQTIPNAFILGENFTNLFLLGNKWNCTKTMKWLLDPKQANHLTDLQFLRCCDKQYQGKSIIKLLEYKQLVKDSCRKSDLKNCTCHVYYIQREGSPIYSINCSSRAFYRLPDVIPINTSVLYLSDNKISDLRPLLRNPMYRTVNDIYLNNNLIESIDLLENSEYLNNFRLLSLDGNLISKISIFPLYNAFNKNSNLQSVFLSKNPWICNCKFTPKFQQFLLSKLEFIRDVRNITCRYESESQFSNKPVLSLTKHELCHLENEVIIIDLVNYVLASLILLILIKLTYDYIQYRHYGRIPWLVKII